MMVDDVFPKFIIEDGNIIIGKCKFHKELAIDCEKVTGGGWFEINNTDKIIYFHGRSEDFGIYNVEEIKKAIEEKRIFNIFMIRNLSDQFRIVSYYDWEFNSKIKHKYK